MTTMLPELGSVRLRETETELIFEVEVPPGVDVSRLVVRQDGSVLTIALPRIALHPHIPDFHPDVSGV